MVSSLYLEEPPELSNKWDYKEFSRSDMGVLL